LFKNINDSNKCFYFLTLFLFFKYILIISDFIFNFAIEMQRACPYCNSEFSSKYSGGNFNNNDDIGFACTNCGAILEEDEDEKHVPAEDGTIADYDADDVLTNGW
jgi:RNA polymerase subunit RPABC4/transcription elongation factor Spt4